MIPRLIAPRLGDALADRPVVLVTGPRQSGKTTLVRSIPGYAYITLDATAPLDAARRDPEGLVAGVREPTVIDEVQRAPGLFRAIKASVDRDRTPGRFILTGSTSAMAVPQASEALAGRMEIITLWPLSFREVAGTSGSVCDMLFDNEDLRLPGGPAVFDPAVAIATGGYPEPLRWSDRRRDAWFRDYVQTVCHRDVTDISDIVATTALPRLLALLASRASGLLNMADVSRAVEIPYATLNRYLALLQAVSLVALTPRWSNNIGLRTVKAPKIALVDTGLASHLLRLDADQVRSGTLLGPLLENLIVMELRKDAGWSRSHPGIHHYRDETGREVDIVLEGTGGRIVGIEVKASASVTSRDAAGLRMLSERLGNRFHRGVLLYTGEVVVPFAANIHAVPYGALWSSG